MPEIPEDIVSDILLRLPVRSLLRFKCVSKQWLSLISDPNFIRRHLYHRKSHPNKDCLFRTSVYCDLYTLDIQSPVATASTVKFQVDTNFNGSIQIWGSCDGLLLLSCIDTLYLVNPSTRESKILPKSPFSIRRNESFVNYALGYDPHTGRYKVVNISWLQTGEYMVVLYDLRTNSWNRIECYHRFLPSSKGIYLNGALHWLEEIVLDSSEDSGEASSGVISLDLGGESFSCLPFPGSEEDEITQMLNLGVLGDCLCGFTDHIDVLVVWVMKEYGVKESWTKFSVRHEDDYIEKYGWVSHYPLCSLRTGKVVIDCGVKLVIVNPENDEREEIVVRGLPTHYGFGTARDTIFYVESLVQVPQFD